MSHSSFRILEITYTMYTKGPLYIQPATVKVESLYSVFSVTVAVGGGGGGSR